MMMMFTRWFVGEINRNRRRDRTSTSEESDFFSLKRQCKYNKYQNLLAANQNRNSSSGKGQVHDLKVLDSKIENYRLCIMF